MANKVQSIKLRVFNIENNDTKYDKSPILDMLGEKLSKSEKAEDRRIQRNSDDPSMESDLIADFDVSRKESFIFGTVIRVTASDGTPSLPDDVFDKKKIPFATLKGLGLKDKFIYRSHFYFATDGRHLIVTLPSNLTISAFQAYINEYLKAERKDHLFEYTPKIINTPETTAGEIKSIRFKDAQVKPHGNASASSAQNQTYRKSLKTFTEDALRYIFKDSPDLDKILSENLVSAEIFLKFAPKKHTEPQQFLGAILKPLADTDNVEIKTKSGSTIKGSTLQETKVVNIGITETGFISEAELSQAMESYLKDLDK